MSGSYSPPPEVLIAMRRFGAFAPSFVAAARRVTRDCPSANMAIDAYHRTRDDIAILRVHFASGTPSWQVASLIVQAMSEGMEAVETARMSSEKWRWYVRNRLPTFLHMANADTLEGAVGMLAERIEPRLAPRRRLAAGTVINARPSTAIPLPPAARRRALTIRDSEFTPACAGELDTDRFERTESE